MSTATETTTTNGLAQSDHMDASATAEARRSNSPYANANNSSSVLQQPPLDASTRPPAPIGPAASLMQLRYEIPPPPPMRGNRKRKSPPGPAENTQDPPPPPQQLVHQLPPTGLMQSHVPQPMPHYQYPPGADYSTAGLPPHLQPPPRDPNMQSPDSPDDPNRSAASRQLSTSKRAEQNRKAQRAFRERRDQHVKALESRSQLLDAALASADEANRRWEECRALVDQLRIENAALRSHLQQIQMGGGNKQMNGDDNNTEGAQGMQRSRQPSVDRKVDGNES